VRTKKLHQILGHYGPEAQKKKSIEELSELITLLAREQTGRVSEGELIEEIADSYNMLDQMAMIYGIKEEVKAIRKAKIDRTLDHINSKTANPCPHDSITNQVCEGYIDRVPEQYKWGVKK
jgi:Ca2+-binding EF-hand superfamily protein